MRTRRDALQTGLAAAGTLAAGSLFAPGALAFDAKQAFEGKTVQEVVRALGGSGWAESKDVTVQGPEIAENGASVPLSLATTLPGVRQLALLVEKNPSALVAVFQVNEAVEAQFAVRAKMAQSSDVYAVAIGADGKAWYAKRDIKVTLGGCGN